MDTGALNKRRVLMLSDQEWAKLGRMAADSGTNRSGVIRGLLQPQVAMREVRDDDLPGLGKAFVPIRPKPRSGGPGSAVMEPQVEIGGAAKSVTTPSFNTRPFTPVPKKGK